MNQALHAAMECLTLEAEDLVISASCFTIARLRQYVNPSWERRGKQLSHDRKDLSHAE
jgi:hypothetical protein